MKHCWFTLLNRMQLESVEEVYYPLKVLLEMEVFPEVWSPNPRKRPYPVKLQLTTSLWIIELYREFYNKLMLDDCVMLQETLMLTQLY